MVNSFPPQSGGSPPSPWEHPLERAHPGAESPSSPHAHRPTDAGRTHEDGAATASPSADSAGSAPPMVWTDAKVDALKRHFGSRDELFLARELGCTPEELLAKAWEIFDEPARSGTWTEGDVDQLRRYLGVAEPGLIGRIIGRSEEDVNRKVVALSLELTAESFSVDEVVSFKRLYGTRTDEDLALIFGRTVQTIARAATELCLSKDKAFLKRHGDQPKPVRMPRWSEAELAELRELYPQTSNLDIAKKLGRSVKSVVSKAHNLGLKKDKARLQQMGRQNVRLRYKRYD